MYIVSLSGGKDSTAMLLSLIEQYGVSNLVAHHQVMPEDWPETLGYNQHLCARLGVPLVTQQIVYEPVGDGTAVKRLAIVDIHHENDVVPLGTPGVIAGLADLALRRRWPPSPATRYCTAYFKIELLDAWIRQHRAEWGNDIRVFLGERAGESPRRAKKQEQALRLHWKDADAYNWLPIHAWSRRQTFRKMRDWGIAPHPAYQAQGMQNWQMYDEDTEGGPRTGCRFCIYATANDLCHQAQRAENLALLHRLADVEQVTGRTWWHQSSTHDLLLEEATCQPQMNAGATMTDGWHSMPLFLTTQPAPSCS